MAITRRRPQAGLLHYSDRGSIYTSENYQALLRQAGMIVSMSRTADCYDNAAMESFFHGFTGECVDFRHEHKPEAAPLIPWRPFTTGLGGTPRLSI